MGSEKIGPYERKGVASRVMCHLSACSARPASKQYQLRALRPTLIFENMVVEILHTQNLQCISFFGTVVYYDPLPKNHNKPQKELHRKSWVASIYYGTLIPKVWGTLAHTGLLGFRV